MKRSKDGGKRSTAPFPIQITAKNPKDRQDQKLAKRLQRFVEESPEMHGAMALLSELISNAHALEVIYGIKINLSVEKT